MVEGYIHVYERAVARTALSEHAEAQATTADSTADAVDSAVGRRRGSVLTRRAGGLSRGYA
jgi:hypothetical protein